MASIIRASIEAAAHPSNNFKTGQVAQYIGQCVHEISCVSEDLRLRPRLSLCLLNRYALLAPIRAWGHAIFDVENNDRAIPHGAFRGNNNFNDAFLVS